MDNMFQGYAHPLARQARLNSGGETNEDIEFGPVPTGKMWVITNLCMVDETTTVTEVRVFLKGFGENHYLLESESLGADDFFSSSAKIYVPEGKSIVFRFVGSTSGDKLAAFVNGFEVEQPGL